MQKTRIFSALLLVTLLCTALSSCFFFPAKPWEEGMLTNTFFSADYLTERGVADFPIPRLDGSYFDAEENILYLNLTREEYDAYIKAVVNYLREKEELKVKGYHCGNDIFGLLIIPIPIYQLAPLDEEHIPYGDNKHLFGFSTEELDESYNGEAEVETPEFVSLTWEPSAKDSGATYTTEMKFPHYYQAEYLCCHHGHDFESVTYPVAGSVLKTTISTCTRCKEETREGYGYGDELKAFSLTVTAGEEFLFSNIPTSAYRGELVKIGTKALNDGDLRVTVNGTEAIRTYSDSLGWTYAFIMPYGDVSVVIETLGDGTLPPAEE